MGEEGLKDVHMMDQSKFFTILFGNEKFELLVGELKLATMMQYGEAPIEFLEFKQTKREVTIATNIVVIVELFVADNISAFHESVNQTIKDLATTPVGEVMLSIIGYIIVERAKHFTSSYDSFLTSFKSTGHDMNRNYDTLKSVFKSVKAAKHM